MNDFMEKASAMIKISTDILFVKNPVGSSMGVAFGVILHAAAGLFAPLLQSIESIKISSLSLFHYITLGVFVFNIRHFINIHKINPEIDEAIKFIETQASKGNISKADAKLQYHALISKIVENVQLDKDSEQVVSAIKGLGD
jgi:hypothetical protein